MLAHALQYLLFVTLSLVAYYALPVRARWVACVASGAAVLALGGLTASGGPRLDWHGALRNLLVASGLTVANFLSGKTIARHADTAKATVALTSIIALDVLVLGGYKYGTSIAQTLFGSVGGDASGDAYGAAAIVPLGISYYAFQAIGYNLEVYWGRREAELHVGRFAAAIFFFPKLASGPIERVHHFLPQLDARRPSRAADVSTGARLVGWGVFKKCVVADQIGMLIGPILAMPRDHYGLLILLAIALYPVQVYHDFSGYTDIALGTARLFGIELAPNFDRPFTARSLSEFWRRWHMSLSSWTNDYLYQPLSLMARSSGVALFGAAVATFVVLGIWHGPRVNYAVFGVLHGVAVATEIAVRRARGRAAPALLPAWAGRGLTLGFYAFTCVFFQAPTFGGALETLQRTTTLFDAHALQDVRDCRYRLAIIAAVLIGMAASRFMLMWQGRGAASPMAALEASSPWRRWGVYYAVGAAILLVGVAGDTGFVYGGF